MSIQEKRELLKSYSVKAMEIKEQLLHNAKNDAEIHEINELKVNDIIVDFIHKKGEHKEFRTFKGWLKEGKAVKKGEQAFLVWGRPKAVQDQEQGKKTEGETEEDKFFPVSFIFSNAQVAARTPKND